MAELAKERRIVLPSLFALFTWPGMLAACSSETTAPGAMDAAAGDAEAPGTSFVPMQWNETESGQIDVVPPGLILMPGETGPLQPRLFDATGAPTATQGAFTFRAADPEVLTVDASGVVVAQAIGESHVIVTDGIHGERWVPVIVSETVPMGPTSAVFERPSLVLEAGQSATFKFALYDRRGRPHVASETTGLEIDPPGAAEISMPAQAAAGSSGVTSRAQTLDEPVFYERVIHASGGGVVRVWVYVLDPQNNKHTLFGEFNPLIPPGAPTAGPCSDVSWQVLGCNAIAAPGIFHAPGLTAPPMRVEIVAALGCKGFQIRRFQAPPARVEVRDIEVMSLAGGVPVAVAPGKTEYRMFYRDSECGCHMATVFPDMKGAWSATCSNGDIGEVNMRRWPSRRFTPEENGARASRQDTFGTRFTPFQATACFENSAEMFRCQDEVPFEPRWAVRDCYLQSGATCKARPGTCVGNFNTCSGRHNVGNGMIFQGPDQFTYGNCKFDRGGNGTCARTLPQPMLTMRMGGTVYRSTKVWATGGIGNVLVHANVEPEFHGNRYLRFIIGPLSGPAVYPACDYPCGGPNTTGCCAAPHTSHLLYAVDGDSKTPDTGNELQSSRTCIMGGCAGGATCPAGYLCDPYDTGDCDRNQNNAAPVMVGSVKVDSMEDAVLRGTFTASLYSDYNCHPSPTAPNSVMVEGEFVADAAEICKDFCQAPCTCAAMRSCWGPNTLCITACMDEGGDALACRSQCEPSYVECLKSKCAEIAPCLMK